MNDFQKQKMIMSFGYSNGFGFRDINFHNNTFSTIATAAVAKLHVYYTKNPTFLKYRQMSLKVCNFVLVIYRAYEQLTTIYDNVSSTGKT